jgi:hypothetical protein
MALDEEKRWSAQTEEGKQFLHDLRKFMRDTREVNELIDEEEIDEASLVLAVRMSVSDFNMEPPLLNSMNFKTILSNGMFAPLLRLSAANVLEMKFQSEERNQLQYSDGKRSEIIHDKAPSYKDTANRFRSSAITTIQRWKVSYNLRSGYGTASGIMSEYAYLNEGI